MRTTQRQSRHWLPGVACAAMLVAFAAPLAHAISLPGSLASGPLPTGANFDFGPEGTGTTDPEITFASNLGYTAQSGYLILLEKSGDPTIPTAGPPNGPGVAGVLSPGEVSRTDDWSDVVYFKGSKAIVISDALDSDGAGGNTTTPRTWAQLFAAASEIFGETISLPSSTDSVYFLMERAQGPGEQGQGTNEEVNKYLATSDTTGGDITYSIHSDFSPSAAVPEPSALALGGIAVAMFGLMSVRRLRRRA